MGHSSCSAPYSRNKTLGKWDEGTDVAKTVGTCFSRFHTGVHPCVRSHRCGGVPSGSRAQGGRVMLLHAAPAMPSPTWQHLSAADYTHFLRQCMGASDGVRKALRIQAQFCQQYPALPTNCATRLLKS